MQNPSVTFEELLGTAVTLKHSDEEEEVGETAQQPSDSGKSYSIDDIEF